MNSNTSHQGVQQILKDKQNKDKKVSKKTEKGAEAKEPTYLGKTMICLHQVTHQPRVKKQTSALWSTMKNQVVIQ